jgi:hypothetical protein
MSLFLRIMGEPQDSRTVSLPVGGCSGHKEKRRFRWTRLTCVLMLIGVGNLWPTFRSAQERQS